ncbi:MAG: hypothetical protein RL693_709, partial [Verrucomicrobiota bacterium]
MVSHRCMIDYLPIPVLALAAETVAHEWNLSPAEVLWKAGIVFFFVVLNGFFVAVEFAIVKV